MKRPFDMIRQAHHELLRDRLFEKVRDRIIEKVRDRIGKMEGCGKKVEEITSLFLPLNKSQDLLPMAVMNSKCS